jgi:1-acyl-sn-glycerol-3-phosphate acyltransferase
MITAFRSLIFTCFLVSLTILFSVLALAALLLPFSWRYWLITRWSYLILILFKIICGVKVKITGLENLSKVKNGIVLCKHQSTWETIFMQTLLPTQTWVLKQELLQIPFFGWALKGLQPIAIDRKKQHSVKQLIQEGKKALQAGKWVIIFPEGTRVAMHQSRKYSKSGVALSAATGYPIIPIAHNAGYCWPKNSFFKHPGVISVVIGAPIQSPPEVESDQLNHQIASWIENTSKNL